ncbi:MAG: VTC domain-containing protein, partial [Coriobacteriales bacterium]|nr:VTC domain-containing protein [Coriobacteriales bacterium]
VRAYGDIRGDEQPVFLEIKKKYRSTVYKRRVRMTLCEAQRFVENGLVPRSPYQDRGVEKAALNRQIMDEMCWSLAYYGRLLPSFLVEYERYAYSFQVDGAKLRLTFDYDVNWREGSWTMENAPGSWTMENAPGSWTMENTPGSWTMENTPGTCSTADAVPVPAPVTHPVAAGCPHPSAVATSRPHPSANTIPARGNPLLAPDICLMEIKTSAPLPLSLTHILDKLALYPRSFSKVGRSYEAFMRTASERRRHE